MSIRQRLMSLERRIIEAGIGESHTCPTCGGPMPGVNRCVLCDKDGNPIDLAKGGKRIPKCPKCGLLVDETGKALSSATAVPARGEVHVKRIILHDKPSRTVLAPTDC